MTQDLINHIKHLSPKAGDIVAVEMPNVEASRLAAMDLSGQLRKSHPGVLCIFLLGGSIEHLTEDKMRSLGYVLAPDYDLASDVDEAALYAPDCTLVPNCWLDELREADGDTAIDLVESLQSGKVLTKPAIRAKEPGGEHAWRDLQLGEAVIIGDRCMGEDGKWFEIKAEHLTFTSKVVPASRPLQRRCTPPAPAAVPESAEGAINGIADLASHFKEPSPIDVARAMQHAALFGGRNHHSEKVVNAAESVARQVGDWCGGFYDPHKVAKHVLRIAAPAPAEPAPAPAEPAAEICPNCDTALPEGCGGIFKDDGDYCGYRGPSSTAVDDQYAPDPNGDH